MNNARLILLMGLGLMVNNLIFAINEVRSEDIEALMSYFWDEALKAAPATSRKAEGSIVVDFDKRTFAEQTLAFIETSSGTVVIVPKSVLDKKLRAIARITAEINVQMEEFDRILGKNGDHQEYLNKLSLGEKLAKTQKILSEPANIERQGLITFDAADLEKGVFIETSLGTAAIVPITVWHELEQRLQKTAQTLDAQIEDYDRLIAQLA